MMSFILMAHGYKYFGIKAFLRINTSSGEVYLEFRLQTLMLTIGWWVIPLLKLWRSGTNELGLCNLTNILFYRSILPTIWISTSSRKLTLSILRTSYYDRFSRLLSLLSLHYGPVVVVVSPSHHASVQSLQLWCPDLGELTSPKFLGWWYHLWLTLSVSNTFPFSR